MKYNYFIKILASILIVFCIRDCIANDSYSLVMQVNHDSCIAILYNNDVENISNNNNIIAKTYCAIANNLEQNNDTFQYDFFFQYIKPILEVALKNLKLELAHMKKQHPNYMPIGNIIIGLYNYMQANSESRAKKDYLQYKTFFASVLRQVLMKNRFFINHKLIIVENNQLLTQAALEYFYNTEIDKSQVEKLLVSNINIDSKNTMVIANANTKKNISLVSKTSTSQDSYQKKERGILYTVFEDGFISYDFKNTTKKQCNNKLILTNDKILQYNIYKLSHYNNPDILITSEYLRYNKKTNKFNGDYASNYKKITNMVTENTNKIHDIFKQDKIDYVILIGNALLNNLVSSLYFQQLEKTQPNLPSDRIYILNNEEFYYYLVDAARTILSLQIDNTEDNFELSKWEYSANTKRASQDVAGMDKNLVGKMHLSLDSNNATSGLNYEYANQPNIEADINYNYTHEQP